MDRLSSTCRNSDWAFVNDEVKDTALSTAMDLVDFVEGEDEDGEDIEQDVVDNMQDVEYNEKHLLSD